jgi:4-diphosphocytidyl-2-C-methyl-D-erythritol kinase
MQSAAINLVPVIHDVITSIAQTDSVVLARMSGSGATCFGIYTDQDACLRAASRINRTHPDWWVSTGQPILDVF